MSGARVLVAGSGAREHAIAWRLAGEQGVGHVIAAPGNALMGDSAELRPDIRIEDHAALVTLARRARVDLVVVGPESPLVAGLADQLSRAGLAVFGPGESAAQLEGSKAFAREVCRAAGVPMADGRAFVTVRGALEYAERIGLPLVIKADGLAAGKGVVICETLAEAERAISDALENGRFGRAGETVVVERWLAGTEASVIALCDGQSAVLLPAARDHKRLGEGDSGPNTGGMGAYSPVDGLDSAALAELQRTVFAPVLGEMAARGTPFRGALFCGLMLTPDGPRVLEFNVRFGDPEAQAILPRLDEPLYPLLLDCATDRLVERPMTAATPEASVALTLAADGYPDAPRAGDPISGLDETRAAGALVFGAGVRAAEDGRLVTGGGRVMTVVGRGADVAAAAEAAYRAADMVDFPGRLMRRDIGRALAWAAA